VRYNFPLTNLSILLLLFLANTEVREVVHVASNSRTPDPVRERPGSAKQQPFCREILPFSKNHARGPWIFIYEPLNFGENMFVVHDVTYEPLYFRKIMFAVHIFSQN
jgi:hypothetical protein